VDRGFDGARHADGASGGELAVGAEEDVGAGAHRLAHSLDHAGGEIDVGEKRLVPALDPVGPGRIELHRREALAHGLDSCSGGKIRIIVDILRAVGGQRIGTAGGRIEIGVGAKPLMHPPAQQLVNRLARFLADDVPAGHLQRRTAGHHGHVRPLREARRVAEPEEILDIVRISADQVTRGDILHQLRGQMRIKGRVIGFAISDDAAVGDQLDEQEVSTAGLWRRVGHHEGFDIPDLHDVLRNLNPASKSIRRNRSGIGGKIQPIHVHPRPFFGSIGQPVEGQASGKLDLTGSGQPGPHVKKLHDTTFHLSAHTQQAEILH
jgi:hypothetical protein